MNVSKEQAQYFKDTLGAAALVVCPRFDVDVKRCVRDAAEATIFGKFAVHNNYFGLVGSGDRGYNVHVVVERTLNIHNGGCKPHLKRVAKYSSPEACVEDYCLRLIAEHGNST